MRTLENALIQQAWRTEKPSKWLYTTVGLVFSVLFLSSGNVAAQEMMKEVGEEEISPYDPLDPIDPFDIPDKRCQCLCGDQVQTYSIVGGVNDNYSTSNSEPATPVPGGPPAWAGSIFDQTQKDKAFAHRFKKNPKRCIQICDAKLKVGVKPLGAGSTNDRIYLYSPYSASPPFMRRWATNLGSGSGPSLVTNPWNTSNYGGGTTFIFNLGALPTPVNGTTNLIPALNTSYILDLVVQDDTSVDYATLRVWYCECNPNPIPDPSTPPTQ